MTEEVIHIFLYFSMREMYIIKLKTNESLLSELSRLQGKGEMCDTRLVADNGSLMVHWAVLRTRGVWWTQARKC